MPTTEGNDNYGDDEWWLWLLSLLPLSSSRAARGKLPTEMKEVVLCALELAGGSFVVVAVKERRRNTTDAPVTKGFISENTELSYARVVAEC